MATRQIAVVLPAALDGASVYVDDVGGGQTTIAHSNGAHAVAEFALTIGSNCSESFTYVKVDREGYKPYRKDAVLLHAGAVQVRVGVDRDPSRHSDTFLPAVPKMPAAGGAIIHPRHGVVTRGTGRMWQDADGPFYPLGVTLFNGQFWFRKDRDHLLRNVEKGIRQYKCDYYRALSSVHFTSPAGDCSVNPTLPTWDEDFVGFVELLFTEFGLRQSLTVFAGADPWFRTLANYESHARRVSKHVKTRLDRFLDGEVCNEASVTGMPLDALESCARILVTESGLALIGATSDIPGAHEDRSKPQQVAPSLGWGCTTGIAQPPRSTGDDGWYEVCVPMLDWKGFPAPVHNNEGVGPGASSVTEHDPLQLAVFRAISIMAGAGAWVLHNGAGILLSFDPARDDWHPDVPANLYDVENIDAIMRAVRGVDPWLPVNATDGRVIDMRAASAPVRCSEWPTGAYRGWMQVHDDGSWWAVLAGIRGQATLTVNRATTLAVFDFLAGPMQSMPLTRGQSVSLQSQTIEKGYGALILHGTFTESTPGGGWTFTEFGGKGSSEEWHAYVDYVRAQLGITQVTMATMIELAPYLEEYGAQWQHDFAGTLRERIYLPSLTADPYARPVDIEHDGDWVWIRRF